MHPIASVNRYPWLLDANVTNAWIADSQWVHTATSLPNIDSWKPAKGGITLAASSCNWQTGYVTSGGPGYISPNASGYVNCDTLAPAISGSDITFSMILVFTVPGAQDVGARLWSGGSSAGGQTLVDGFFPAPATTFAYNRRDAAGLLKTSGTHSPGTTAAVATYLFNGSTKKLNSRLNRTNIDVNVDFDVAAVTMDRFALLALVTSPSNPAVHFSTALLRAFIFCPGILLSPGSYGPIENYFCLEDGIP